MSRAQAHIEKIERIDDIPGYDKVGLATVLGWQVIVSKSEFKVGDKCVYIEIDSKVPADEPAFEFLSKRDWKVKTIRMCKVVSQGLCCPLHVFKVLTGNEKIGEDVSEKLRIVKYDPQAEKEQREVIVKHSKLYKLAMKIKPLRKLIQWVEKANKVKGMFPSEYISKTDEERIQNIPLVIKNNIGEKFNMTEKLDGQSSTYLLIKNKKYIPLLSKKYQYIICSRNLRVNENSNTSYAAISKKTDMKNILIKLFKGCKSNGYNDVDFVCIQGEICGPGIQKNKYKFEDYELRVFNMFAGKKGETKIQFTQEAMEGHCEKFGLEPVPNLGTTKFTKKTTVQDVVEYSIGESIYLPIQREGIVYRHYKEDGSCISFKAINPEFLIKNDE